MDTKSPSMDDVLAYVSRFAEGSAKHCTHAMFYFLYKEIIVNRMLIMENSPDKNRAALEHNEKLINQLNTLLMEQMEKKG